MGFHHAGQAGGLGHLTSGGPPTLTSQSAGITGVSHRAQPEDSFLIINSGSKSDQIAQFATDIPDLHPLPKQLLIALPFTLKDVLA